MRPFTLLIKPASADCNLRCEYCFYLGKCALYPDTKHHRMSDEVLEQMIKTYMATEQPTYSFGWQGGEPMLMGVDFFQKAANFEQKYGRSGAVVGNGLQTNATLIDETMAKVFGEYKFLVGCSLDGPSEIHDLYRRTIGGEPSHSAVVRGIDALRSYDVAFNILILVSQANVHRAADVYRYLRKEGFLYHQYIPCVEFDENGALAPFSITGEEWGKFLCGIFDEWYPNDAYTVSIRQFDSIILKMLEGVANVCSMAQDCCQYFVVEYNGDIYPCDFFVDEPLKIGNVMDTSWEQALESAIYRDFGARKTQWNETCASCDCLDLCNGDCLKHRMYAGNPSQNISHLCSGWKRFVRHSRESFEKLVEEIRQKRTQEERLSKQVHRHAMQEYASVGRNDPCPCGSGRKFKKCCGR